VIALVAAVLGGLAVLLGGWATGLVGGKETLYVPATSPAPSGTGASSSAPPLVANRFDPAAVYAKRAPGVVTLYSSYDLAASHPAASAQGSGFVVSGDGVVLTNAHVITTAGQETGTPRPASKVYVEFGDGDRVPAEIVGWDLFTDVGVVRIDPKAHALNPVPLGDSAAVAVGEPVAAIGSPFGNQNSLAVGVVSATRRSIPSLTSGYDADQPRQLRRAALRRARARDRDQRADPLRLRQRRGRRLRDPD
jgi:S1-C subfamily serine protease